MGLDIRLPLGLMFAIIGALLTGYGAISPDRSQSLGINVNLIWGAAILAFSALMLVGWRFSKQAPPSPSDAKPSDRPRGH